MTNELSTASATASSALGPSAGRPAGRRYLPAAAGVAYLASERSDWCTGQTISAHGYEIGLYNIPQVIRQIASPGPWDLEMMTRMIEQSFQPVVTGSGGPFRR